MACELLVQPFPVARSSTSCQALRSLNISSSLGTHCLSVTHAHAARCAIPSTPPAGTQGGPKPGSLVSPGNVTGYTCAPGFAGTVTVACVDNNGTGVLDTSRNECTCHAPGYLNPANASECFCDRPAAAIDAKTGLCKCQAPWKLMTPEGTCDYCMRRLR